MRLFVAISLPDHVISAIEALSRRLPSPRLKWVPPSSLHITLRFLGETPEHRLPGFTNALTTIAGGVAPFDIAVAGGGVFPDERRPRVFWAGLTGRVERLADLSRAMTERFVDLGVPAEARPYTPHLTLARCKAEVRCQPDDARRFLAETAPLAPPPFSVDSVHLVRSHLGGAAPRYETLRSFPLAA